MERRAAIAALEALHRPCRARLHTDSRYVRHGIMQWIARWKRNGWRTAARQPDKHEDQWRRLGAALAGLAYEWAWVRGHRSEDTTTQLQALMGSQHAVFALHNKR